MADFDPIKWIESVIADVRAFFAERRLAANSDRAIVETRNRSTEDVQRAINGFALSNYGAQSAGFAGTGAAIGATIGSVVPLIGNAIGGAIGAAVGAIVGLVPYDRIAMINTLHERIRSLPPWHRYAVCGALRGWLDPIVAAERRKGVDLPAIYYGPWRAGNPNLHTIYEGPEVMIGIFMREILVVEGCFPTPPDNVTVGTIGVYACAWMAANLNDDQRLKDQTVFDQFLYGVGLFPDWQRQEYVVEQQFRMGWLARRYRTMRDRKALDIRRLATSTGLPDYANLPLPPAVRALVLA